jgi:hypothetical protein
MKPTLLILIFLLSSSVSAQTTMSLYASQASSENWKTGKKSFWEVGAAYDLRETGRIDTLILDLRIKIASGFRLEQNLDLGKEFIIPTDNELFGEAVLKYPLGWALDPFISASFDTQPTVSFRLAQDKLLMTGKFMDPITGTQAVGFAFKYSENKDFITSRIGFALKQFRADKFTKLTDDRKTTDIIETYKEETGLQWTTDSFFEIDSNFNYKATVDLFTTYESPEIWTVKWQNEFKSKVWRFLTVSLKLDLFYDEKQMKKLQFGQSLRLGVSSEFI